MKEYGLYESAAVKVQTLKTAIEVRHDPPHLVIRIELTFLSFLAVGLPSSPCRRVSNGPSSHFVGALILPFFSCLQHRLGQAAAGRQWQRYA